MPGYIVKYLGVHFLKLTFNHSFVFSSVFKLISRGAWCHIVPKPLEILLCKLGHFLGLSYFWPGSQVSQVNSWSSICFPACKVLLLLSSLPFSFLLIIPSQLFYDHLVHFKSMCGLTHAFSISFWFLNGNFQTYAKVKRILL